jgi:ethylbenzene dioxygenase alpha subunit
MENWHWSTAASKGTIVGRYPYNYQLFGGEKPLHGPTEFGLPGLFASIMSDENHRRYYKRWAEMMTAKSWDEMLHEPVR